MSRKPRVQRTPEEKWQIVLEVLKSGNVSDALRTDAGIETEVVKIG